MLAITDVALILRISRQSQVRASTVETVAVLVVDLHTFRCI